MDGGQGMCVCGGRGIVWAGGERIQLVSVLGGWGVSVGGEDTRHDNMLLAAVQLHL